MPYDLDEVLALVEAATDAYTRLGTAAWWKLAPDGLDEISRRLEHSTRLAWAAQVALAGEYEQQSVA
ncbi:hypothetical protein GIS00_26205, partial [Nakamurella sp. YIM 132087]|nr:hypothetical protein [Nakamurella alba]